ncbi:MAG: cytochrome c [Bacteroidia bacterium]|nr:cytochrome c [Bacteroidia bacterium]
MNKYFYITFSLVGFAALLSSCSKSRGNNPGVEYAPDMYYDKGYEPFKEKDSNTLNKFGSNLREPVKGTIAVGKLDYAYPLENNGQGYEESATKVNYPENFVFDKARGERLYNIYCSPCHGIEGHNDGNVFKKVPGIKPPWPGYDDNYIKTLPVGKMYHVITYGKNNMGSHASVLTPEERWQVIAHIQELSGVGYHKTVVADQPLSDNVSNNN